jgi:hypothetical protein
MTMGLVLVAHHARGHPRDDLLIAVRVHPDVRAGVEERLDDRRQRPVAVVIVLGDRQPGEVEVDAEAALVLRVRRASGGVDLRMTRGGLVHADGYGCGRKAVLAPW